MKKILMMAMMAAAATTAFAQDALVKEAKKLYSSGNLAEAAQKLTPALTSAETTDKAAAWNLMNDIQYKIYSDEYQKMILNQSADTMKAVVAFLDGFKAATKCDEYAQQPNEKGKVKNPYRKSNAPRYLNERHLMYNIGAMCYQSHNMKGAIKAWESYIGTGASSIYDETKLAPDTLIADAAYNSAYLSYLEKDYNTALALAEKALTYPGKEEGCVDLILYTMKDKCTNHADSLVYLERLKKEHQANPGRDLYFNLLQDYYARSNDTEAMMKWAEEETKINANNKMAWALLGEAKMNSEKWDDAIVAFKKAIEIDPTWVPVVFNTGICYNSKAIILNEQLMDKNTMRISNENAEKVKEVVREAQKYMERTRELDPNHEQARWTYPLYRIYYTLDMKDKMAELEAIDPSLKDI
jgi:tetratricopeptide (TPR) repeat protein